jgi:hypothetical protein
MNLYTFYNGDDTVEVEARNYVAAYFRLMLHTPDWTEYKHIQTTQL